MLPPGPHTGKFSDKLLLTMIIIIIIIIAIQLTVLMVPTNDGRCHSGGKKKYLQINSVIKLISWLDHPSNSFTFQGNSGMFTCGVSIVFIGQYNQITCQTQVLWVGDIKFLEELIEILATKIQQLIQIFYLYPT